MGTAKSADTEYFYALTPDRVMDQVESVMRSDADWRATGRCFALNSFENRVYEVELEDHDGNRQTLVAKFYRPGRWNREQIDEEHQFLKDLVATDLPAIAALGPVTDVDGIACAVFPKVGGRAPEELNDDQLIQVGRLLARIHGVGKTRQAKHRIRLDPKTYGTDDLKYLLESGRIPAELRSRYEDLCREMISTFEPWFSVAGYQRIHGDCHLQNLLAQAQVTQAAASPATRHLNALKSPFVFLDFDDMVQGPVVQDLWLLLPGRGRRRQFSDEFAGNLPEGTEADLLAISPEMESLLEGYQEFADFPRSQLRLIEPLRVLRMIHYSAWLSRRWEDPAFPRAFPQFESPRYWQDELQALELEHQLISWLKVRDGGMAS
ncbi:MAG: serine/threonine protein kinase [Bdellovibrionales bacterium]|nr:serine/threonine protein kinase [Bdellovibrionales bacterium]